MTEINIFKNPGLTELSFEILLPQVQYPFAYYPNGFQKAQYYLDVLGKIHGWAQTVSIYCISSNAKWNPSV